MKQLMVALAVTALTAVGFADEHDWFTAGFGASAESIGGKWAEGAIGVAAAPQWDEKTLVLPSASESVVFQADESRSAVEDTSVFFDTTVGFVVCKELPDIEPGAKTGICALKDGNFYVVGYDDEGASNKWVDTGISSISGSVPVTLSVTNGIARYTIDSTPIDDVNISAVAKDFREVHYAGTGTVTRLNAKYSSYEVDINLSSVAIESLVTTCEVSRAEVGSTVKVRFMNGEKASTKPNTWFDFVVRGDGSLEYTGDPSELPTAKDAAAGVGDDFFATLEEAFEAVEEGGTITILSSLTNRSNFAITKDCTIDANGNLVLFTGEIAIEADVNLVCSGETTGKGFKFGPDPEAFVQKAAYVLIAADKTLDATGLSFGEGLDFGSESDCYFCLDLGAVYKQSSENWSDYVWDRAPWWGCGYGYELKRMVTDETAIFTAVPEGTLWVMFHDAEVTDASVTNNIREFTADTETFALPTSNEVQAVENMLFLGWTNYAGTVVTQIVQGTTKDVDVYAVWESLYKVVTFTTNGVENVVATTNIYKGTALTEAEIPEIFTTLKGAWDVDPVGATITCDTNFNFKISAGGWEQAESAPEGAKASEVWGDEIPAALAGADAKKLAKWAEDNGIAFEDGATIKPEAFLLNCANDEAAIEAALTEFKFVKVLPEEKPVEDWFGDDFKYNGTLTILGSDDLVNWVEAKATHHFFKGVLSF